ncbi:MAG: PD-(D/E)XK nuclease family protein [Spirochaetes bacterium]|nr:PD-(D/E)XK nuclease family protein [Spirochaetota bacterium]
MNIFRILSSYDGSINEPNVSAFLAYLLDPYSNHGIAGLLLQKILGEFLIKEKTFFITLTRKRIKK